MNQSQSRLSSMIFEADLPFRDKALQAYQLQVLRSPVYRVFSQSYYAPGELPDKVENIPLLPIRAFKDTEMIVEGAAAELTFKSSGTGSMTRSKHPVADQKIYETAVIKGFEQHFSLSDHVLLCYTPGYNENPDSSLLRMLDFLIKRDDEHLSRFLPLDQPLQTSLFDEVTRSGRTIILFGAAFGLLDLVEMNSAPLPDGSHIIETGGMKTYRREMEKSELRQVLGKSFKIPGSQIHSEYGMCELLSQMYAIGGVWFTAPHWVHMTVRDPRDPFRICKPGEEGKIGIIDLANIFSCPFILTEDRGVMNEDGEIAVLGRWHGAELRGCNFLMEQD